MNERNKSRIAYPLGQKIPEHLKSRTGMRYKDIQLEKVRQSGIQADDLSIHADTLRMQALVAVEAGYQQFANNLRRAAELVEIPNERLVEIYEALRPYHSTYAELLMICDELEKDYDAPESARFIREAAKAYQDAGLCRRSDKPVQSVR